MTTLLDVNIPFDWRLVVGVALGILLAWGIVEVCKLIARKHP